MTTFKEVFEEKTTPNLEIKKYQKFNPLPLLAICSFVLVAMLITPSSTSQLPSNPPSEIDSEIYINPLHKIDLVDSNVTTKETSDLQYPFIGELEKSYTLLDSKSIYTSQNQLDSYQLQFDQFMVSFSETNRPSSDFSMSKNRPQYSKINQVDVAFYNYKDTYYASFEYNHMFFEIESVMTIEELVGVLNTIIK